MTRPHIIRADTIDLQDKTSPTAKDHSHQPQHPAPLGIGPAAPHQQAAIRQVEQERNSEEARLQDAWSDAGSQLRDDPGSDDDRTVMNNANPRNGPQQDEQAVRLNGGASADNDDADMQDADEEDMDDDMMDKISSSPSIDDEDIDFEFVYALHTFVATVEGQANATKGDTMVLLDDSNSYWWLVRVVKDNSIGYLPAEHIETPTERLARLNKHRNIDLSATMLGDTAEKSKNPLKKAMRRRNAKTVQFAPPTYVEASDYDYSSDEGEGELFGGPEPKQLQQQQAATQDGDAAQEENLQVQPLKVNGAKKDGQTEGDARSSSEESAKRSEDRERGSEDAVDRPLDPKSLAMVRCATQTLSSKMKIPKHARSHLLLTCFATTQARQLPALASVGLVWRVWKRMVSRIRSRTTKRRKRRSQVCSVDSSSARTGRVKVHKTPWTATSRNRKKRIAARHNQNRQTNLQNGRQLNK